MHRVAYPPNPEAHVVGDIAAAPIEANTFSSVYFENVLSIIHGWQYRCSQRIGSNSEVWCDSGHRHRNFSTNALAEGQLQASASRTRTALCDKSACLDGEITTSPQPPKPLSN